jgi:hypothetical protein
MKEQFYKYIQISRSNYRLGLEAVDGHAKLEDLWERRKVEEEERVIEMELF